jgi:murein L,D-transpeptidase YafK
MRRRLILLVALTALAMVAALALRNDSPQGQAEKPGRASAPMTSSLPTRAPVEGPRGVVIHKAERVLGLYRDGRLAATYPIALGHSPEGHKEREGDGRTPEGLYSICNRNPRSRFHLFLGLSYPNADDADAARRAGRISKAEHRQIVDAIEAGRQPPWDTPLGGEIGIHGAGTASDWTLGCIALENEAIEQLWETLRLGDPVLIQP